MAGTFDAGSVVAKIKADLTNFQDGIKKVQDSAKTMTEKVKGGVDKMNASIKSMEPQLKKGALVLGAVAAAGALMLNDWRNAAAGAQVEMARFNATLAAIGDVSEETKEQLLGAAGAAVQLGFDDEETANVMADFYQRTKDVTQATNLNNVAMDLARKKSISLSDAANLVTQVLSGNGRVLKQYGIDVKESSTPLEALAELQSVVGGQAEAFMETTIGKGDRLAVSIGNLKESLGDALLPIMDKITDATAALVGWFNDLSPSIKNMIAYVAFFVATVAAIGAPVLGFITLIPLLTAGLASLGVVLTVLTGPIGLIIAAVGLLAFAWTSNFLGIRDFLQPWVDWLYTMFQSINAIIQEHGGWIALIPTAWGILVESVTAFLTVLRMNIEAWITIVTLRWTTFWNNVNNFFMAISLAIQIGMQSFWSAIDLIFSTGSELLTAAWKGFMDGIKSIASGAWEGVKNIFVSGINWIIDKMNSFIRGLGNVTGAVGKAIGQKGWSIPEIPKLAQGGIVTRPTLAMIGEGGEPEAVIPLSKMGGMGGGVHIHVEGAIIGSVDAAVEVLDMAMRRLQPRLGV